MPLTWTIDHTTRQILATASGAVGRHDIAVFLAAIPGEGGAGYRSILDVSAATVELHAGDLKDFSKLTQSRKRDDCDGAIAIVVTSEAEKALADAFADRTRTRLARLFSSIGEAHAWFATLDNDSQHQSKAAKRARLERQVARVRKRLEDNSRIIDE